MAERAHSSLAVNGFSNDTVRVIRWTGLLATDTGDWVTVPLHTEYSVHVYGTGGVGGSVQIEGSNEIAAAPTAPVILNDTRGAGGTNRMLFTVTGGFSPFLVQGLESPLKMRPNVTAGDGSVSLTVVVCFRKAVAP